MKFADILNKFSIIGDSRVFCAELKRLSSELGDIRLTKNQVKELCKFIASRLINRSDDCLNTSKMLCVEVIENIDLVKIIFVDVEEVIVTDKVEFTIFYAE